MTCFTNKLKDNFNFDHHSKQVIPFVLPTSWSVSPKHGELGHVLVTIELPCLLLKLSSLPRISSQCPYFPPYHPASCLTLTFYFRADILKNEMKVFFVKYNDPIYVKLEKLDIMIRLANQQNIAQVLAELKE